VIVVNSKFFRKPKKKKLTLFDLAKLCEYTCQYCFEKFPLKQLTIDHVNPRSRGGDDTHDNRVCCCRDCNLKKSNFTPWFDKNGQIPRPPQIPTLMLNAEKIRPEWNDFLKNVF
jgi:5-methylcytosine-specific restriction endonuclease McrA